MATKIIHKKSSTPSSVPAAGDIEPGELALNLADQKIYSKTTGGTVVEMGGGTPSAADLLTSIKTVDGSGSGLDADLLDGLHGSSYLRSDSNDTTSANLGGGLDSALYGFVLPQNPEGKHIKSPFFFNDIAYSRIRGATVSVDVDGTPMTSTSAIDAMFNTSGDFWNMATAGVTTATITVTNAPKTLTYGSYIGISFGNTNWRAKSVTLQYSTDGGTTWTTARAVTNQSEEFVVSYFGLAGGVSTNAFRWILSDFNTTSMRVASLFAYNYNSGGMKDLYVSRDGGSIYSDVSVSGNIAVSGTVDGRDVAADGSKLDGIEAGATADQTAAEILTAIKTVDGSGSGLDADVVDGLQASQFIRSDAADTASGVVTFTDRIQAHEIRTNTNQELILSAGESFAYATGQTNEYVYLNAESGIEINSSPDNWTSGWAGRNTAYINKSDASSSFPGNVDVSGALQINGTTRIDSSGFVSSATPAAPSISATNIVNETIEVVFGQSSTSDIDAYEVWSNGGGTSYGMIARILPEDFAATMTVVDSSFNVSGTIGYKVYAVKSGVSSTAGTASKAFPTPTLDVTNLTVVPELTSYEISYDLPDSRFLDHVEIYRHADASLANLSRSLATLIYSGNRDGYTYNISSSDMDKYHQFWVECVET